MMNDNKPTLKDEARSLFVRLRFADQDERPALEAERDQWIAKSQAHREAFADASELFEEATVSKASDVYGEVLAGQRLVSERLAEQEEAASRPWLRYAAVAAVVATALFLISTRSPVLEPDSADPIAIAKYEPLSTSKGEIREFRLADGSVAILDTDTRLEVSMTNAARRLRLAQGRARFNVANDPRPFTVEAGSGEIVASVASFDVGYQDSNSVDVRLISGNATLRPSAQFANYKYPSQNLVIGKPLTVGAKDFQVANAPASENGQWPGGWIESKSIRLDTLVALANKYTEKPIKIESAGLNSLEVSGRFKISDTKGFVSRICDLFDLTARDEISGIYLRKK